MLQVGKHPALENQNKSSRSDEATLGVSLGIPWRSRNSSQTCHDLKAMRNQSMEQFSERLPYLLGSHIFNQNSWSVLFFRVLQKECGKRSSITFFVFRTLSVTFRSLFLTLLSLFSSLFCQTPFAGLLLRQGDFLENRGGPCEPEASRRLVDVAHRAQQQEIAGRRALEKSKTCFGP